MKGRINLRCQLPMIPVPHTKRRKHNNKSWITATSDCGSPGCWKSYSRVQISMVLYSAVVFWSMQDREPAAHQNLRGGENCLMTSSWWCTKSSARWPLRNSSDLPSSPALGKSQGLSTRLKLWFILCMCRIRHKQGNQRAEPLRAYTLKIRGRKPYISLRLLTLRSDHVSLEILSVRDKISGRAKVRKLNLTKPRNRETSLHNKFIKLLHSNGNISLFSSRRQVDPLYIASS